MRRCATLSLFWASSSAEMLDIDPKYNMNANQVCLDREEVEMIKMINKSFMARCLMALLALSAWLIVPGLTAAAEAAGSQPQTAARTEEPGDQVDPHATQILRRACTVLADSNAFTFHAEINFDQVMPSEVKLQFAGASDFAVRRPNALAVDYESDLGAKRLWYNGKTLTIFDAPTMTYASTPVPPSIDGMLESVAQMHNITIPLADLAMSNPCEKISNKILFGSYVGVGDVGGVACDHLAFAQSNVDWQIWIQRSGKPLPRKVVINYRTTPGLPEYAAVISDWKFPATISNDRFTVHIPKKAVRIKIVDVKEPQP